jgi:hypothetical protein
MREHARHVMKVRGNVTGIALLTTSLLGKTLNRSLRVFLDEKRVGSHCYTSALAASFVNRPHLLKYEEKTHTQAASTAVDRALPWCVESPYAHHISRRTR